MRTFGWKSPAMARHYSEQGQIEAALSEHRLGSPMGRLMGEGKRERR